MRADFRDIRITDIRGNALNFCRVSYTAFTTSLIWVKLPAYDKKIFLYYGNGGVASASNGDNTFEFFDDFKSSATLNAAKWSKYGTASIVNGQLKIGTTSSTSSEIKGLTTFGEGYRAIIRASIPLNTGQFAGVGFLKLNNPGFGGAGGGWVTYGTSPVTSFVYDSYTTRTSTSDYSGAFHVFDFSRMGSGNTRLIIDGNTIIASQASSRTDALPIAFREYDANKYVYIDYCFVVKYSAVETTLSLGQKYITQQKGYPFSNSITINSTGTLTPGLSITDYTSAAAGLGFHPGYSVMKPLFRRPEPRGPYRAWNFKGDIKVTNPQPTAGYQTNLWFMIPPGMARDARDLRFSDIRGNPLNYWIEAVSAGAVLVWVELPALDTKIHYYYGNGAAKSASNGDNTFEFFDDFQGNALDTNKWTPATTGNGAITVSNGSVRLSATSGYAQIMAKTSFNSPINIRQVFTVADTNTGARHRTNPFRTGGDTGLFDGKIYWDGLTTPYDTVSTYVLLQYWTPSSQCIFQLYNYYTNATVYTNTGNALSGPQIPFMRTGDGGGALRGDWTFQFIFVRKYAQSQPALDIIRHYPQQLPLYQYSEEIAASPALGLHATDAVFTEYRELKDFALITTNIKKSIQDIYWSLSSDFADDIVPARGSTIKFYAYDSLGNSDFLFIGKSINKYPTLGWLGNTVKLEAADRAQGLAIQKIPWDARVLTLGGSFVGWDTWINYLCNYSVNDLTPCVINRPNMPTTQITLDPKNTRLEAIKKIADYCNYIFFTKWINTGTLQAPSWKTGVYFLHPADIDLEVGGLDLPEPITLTYPDPSLIDLPTLSPDLENNYNTVTLYGTGSANGLFGVCTVCTPEVVSGAELMREYVIEDNLVNEKCSTDEIEAVKWLNYFTSRQATIKVKFVNRFDLQLYQRLRFGAGFSDQLQGLTNMAPLSFVRCYDPRDPSNYRDDDMSGIPRPVWLRITDISYNCGPEENITEVTLIPDFIYSNADPYLEMEWSQYIGNGYLKPQISDSTSTTQSMIDNTVSKQAGPEEGTIMSVASDGKTAEVLTKDGKTVTVNIIT